MQRTLLKSKIHRATVTGADLHYEGSVTVDRELLEAADIRENEQVQIYSVTSGARLTTYAIAGEAGGGEVRINGAAAHLVGEGETVIIASYAALAGHIRIGRRAFVSGGVVIHQFSRVGELSMIGGGSKVNLDVPPFFTVDGVPARAVGLNTVGLKRAGVDEEDLRVLKQAYRLLYRSKLSRREALVEIDALSNEYTRKVADFVRESERGVCHDRAR